MKQRQISGRTLRRGTPEETLAPGESIIVKKQGGKVFELRRIDSGRKSLTTALDQLLSEIPPEGERIRTDLARIIIEDRE